MDLLCFCFSIHAGAVACRLLVGCGVLIPYYIYIRAAAVAVLPACRGSYGVPLSRCRLLMLSRCREGVRSACRGCRAVSLSRFLWCPLVAVSVAHALQMPGGCAVSLSRLPCCQLVAVLMVSPCRGVGCSCSPGVGRVCGHLVGIGCRALRVRGSCTPPAMILPILGGGAGIYPTPLCGGGGP